MIMTKHNSILTLVVAGIILAGLLLGQSQFPPPPAPPGPGEDGSWPATGNGYEWVMVSQNVATAVGGGSNFVDRVRGHMYLYNRRTGKVYLYFAKCTSGNVESDQGCFFAIPTLHSGEAFVSTPRPQASGF